MGIPVKRYSFFSEETTLPVIDMKSVNVKDVLNSANREWVGAKAQLNDLIASASGRLNISGIKAELNAIKNPISEKLAELKGEYANARDTASSLANDLNSQVSSLKDAVGELKDNELVRDVKGIYGSAKSLSSLGNKAFEEVIKSQLPKGSMLERVFSGMSAQCKVSAFKSSNIGKPYNPSIKCGTNNSRRTSSTGCSSNQFADVLNTVTKGGYNSTYSDLNSTLNGLVNLTNFGYNMNMCGVFSALSKDVTDKSVLTRAAAGIFGSLGTNGNTFGVLELGKTLLTENLGVLKSVKNEFPGVVGTLANGVKRLTDVSENERRVSSEGLVETFNMLDEKWLLPTDTGDSVSLENIASGENMTRVTTSVKEGIKSIDFQDVQMKTIDWDRLMSDAPAAVLDDINAPNASQVFAQKSKEWFSSLSSEQLSEFTNNQNSILQAASMSSINADLSEMLGMQGLSNDIDIADLDAVADDNITLLASNVSEDSFDFFDD